RDAFRQVGLFRPYLTTGGDADICWRIQQETGWAIAFAESAVVQHRHRSTLAELRSQWQRYGRSNQYLHDLHAVPLNPPLSTAESIRRLTRWLLKEIPQHVLRKSHSSKNHSSNDWITLLSTPLSLWCIHARSAGQRQAQLASKAKEIESWEVR
ncbi:MAG: glycosyltransferase, partial [Leptolyngbyaceae bacterium]|nr:glycosyltransferase [Leptolyngbyaceae bacterium]